MKTVIIIPARYKSTRFPGKPLANILGIPMIKWVANLSSMAIGKNNVYIATEDIRIFDYVSEEGFNAIMTSNKHETGTDRVAEAIENINADIFINVQGDEPLVDPKDILAIKKMKEKNFNKVINGFCFISKNENSKCINIPKVVTTEKNLMVYMSRNPLPGYKNSENAPANYKKQVCIYAFSRNELMAFKNFGRKSVLESHEDIEILRFLELNIPVLMVKTKSGSLAVDVPEDIPPVENALKNIHNL